MYCDIIHNIMEKGEGRNPEPEGPTPVDQRAEQVQQKTPDSPGGDIFAAPAEDIQSKISHEVPEPNGSERRILYFTDPGYMREYCRRFPEWANKLPSFFTPNATVGGFWPPIPMDDSSPHEEESGNDETTQQT